MTLDDLTLAQTRQALDQGQFSALELADFYLARIAARNPRLNAFIAVTAESAQAEARQADQARTRGQPPGRLRGIPLALKDLFDQRDVPTTAGSKFLRGFIPHDDAVVTARLRAAGAVLLGKTNLHEWAYGVTNDNPHFGRAVNPWDHERTPGGSSGGSAVAVAARLCLGALGSDTGGSIRIPSSLCGVTGIKPTYGRVSLRGVVPLSWFMDHAGPLAQTAEDCALLLGVIAGYDSLDPASVDMPVPDYTASLDMPLTGLRVALPGGYFQEGVDAEILEALQEARGVLQARGARISEKEMPFAGDMFTTNRTALSAEAAALHAERMEKQPEDFGADVLTRLRRGAAIPAAEYVRARRRQQELIRALDLYFADVDLLLTPTTRTTAPKWGEDAVTMAQNLTACTGPFNLTGFPAISLPCGLTRAGLPLGMQFVARRWNEELLLRAAHQYQLVTDWHKRRPPDKE